MWKKLFQQNIRTNVHQIRKNNTNNIRYLSVNKSTYQYHQSQQISSAYMQHHDSLIKFQALSFLPPKKYCKPKETINTDVLIVGGGAIGLSIQYHLLKQGIDATLIKLEEESLPNKYQISDMIWSLNTCDVYMEMINYTKTLIEYFQTSVQEKIWSQNGGMFLASQSSSTQELYQLKKNGDDLGIACNILTPNEVKNFCPILNTSNIKGGLYSSTDGTIDSLAFLTALQKKNIALQGTIVNEFINEIEYYSVIEAGKSKKIITGVNTDTKKIKANCIVNAAGSMSNFIMAMLREELPLRILKNAYFISDAIPGNFVTNNTFPNVRDLDLLIYLRALLPSLNDGICIGGYQEHLGFWKQFDNYNVEMFNLDSFDERHTKAIYRCHILEGVKIKYITYETEIFTPDHIPLVGFHPSIKGLFQVCGLNSMEISLSGGLGKKCSDWIISGTPSSCLFKMDASRFD